MFFSTVTPRAFRKVPATAALLALCTMTVGAASVTTSAAAVNPPAVNLGSAAATSVLAGAGVACWISSRGKGILHRTG